MLRFPLVVEESTKVHSLEADCARYFPKRTTIHYHLCFLVTHDAHQHTSPNEPLLESLERSRDTASSTCTAVVVAADRHIDVVAAAAAAAADLRIDDAAADAAAAAAAGANETDPIPGHAAGPATRGECLRAQVSAGPSWATKS